MGSHSCWTRIGIWNFILRYFLGCRVHIYEKKKKFTPRSPQIQIHRYKYECSEHKTKALDSDIALYCTSALHAAYCLHQRYFTTSLQYITTKHHFFIHLSTKCNFLSHSQAMWIRNRKKTKGRKANLIRISDNSKNPDLCCPNKGMCTAGPK